MTVTSNEIGVERFGLFIGGEFHAAQSGATFTRESPYDGSVVAEYANGDEADAALAIGAARRTFDAGAWPNSSARERSRILRGAAELLEREADRMADLIVREGGKPIDLARGEVMMAAKTFDFFAGAVLADEGSAISQRVSDALGLILKEPVGVAGMITSWNFPIAQIAQKSAAALAAGCTIVSKPSHYCAGPTMLLAEHLQEAGLPPGIFNVVTTDIDRGALVGQHLSAAVDVDVVSFTGSTLAGRAVMRAAATNTKRISLELGGKSANIVFDDAPFEAAARTAIHAFCFYSGQQCSAGSRLLVQRGIHERFLEAVVAHGREQVLGDPSDPRTTMGPLINSDQLQRVLGYIDVGRADGELVFGGRQPNESGDPGLFVEPTVFDGVPISSRLAQEEVFGPVLAVIPFDTEAEAISLANDSEYGLAGGVWTRSIDTALRVVKGVRTGKMFVNSYNTAGIDDMPHGGYKNSGIGRELAAAGLAEYQELKTVQIKLGS